MKHWYPWREKWVDVDLLNSPIKKLGRPLGTTKENGYKVSPGSPVSIIKDWMTFEKKFFQGLNNLK